MARFAIGGNLIVAGTLIIAQAVSQAAVYHRARLKTADQGVKLLGLRTVDGERRIEPDNAEGPIARHQFSQLGFHFAIEVTLVPFCGLVWKIPIIARMHPTAVQGRAGFSPAGVVLLPVERLE